MKRYKMSFVKRRNTCIVGWCVMESRDFALLGVHGEAYVLYSWYEDGDVGNERIR